MSTDEPSAEQPAADQPVAELRPGRRPPVRELIEIDGQQYETNEYCSNRVERELDYAAKLKRAMDLRVMGLPYAQVAKIMGISTASAQNYILRGIKKTYHESGKAARNLELTRLDKMQAGLQKRMKHDETWVDAYKLMLDIMKLRSRYLISAEEAKAKKNTVGVSMSREKAIWMASEMFKLEAKYDADRATGGATGPQAILDATWTDTSEPPAGVRGEPE